MILDHSLDHKNRLLVNTTAVLAEIIYSPASTRSGKEQNLRQSCKFQCLITESKTSFIIRLILNRFFYYNGKGLNGKGIGVKGPGTVRFYQYFSTICHDREAFSTLMTHYERSSPLTYCAVIITLVAQCQRSNHSEYGCIEFNAFWEHFAKFKLTSSTVLLIHRAARFAYWLAVFKPKFSYIIMMEFCVYVCFYIYYIYTTISN